MTGNLACLSPHYTATGGIDRQTLGNGVINHFSYDAASNRLERIYTAKPSNLALVDLTYAYDLAGNISSTQATAGAQK